jgi:hypothetical protein
MEDYNNPGTMIPTATAPMPFITFAIQSRRLAAGLTLGASGTDVSLASYSSLFPIMDHVRMASGPRHFNDREVTIGENAVA